MQHTTGCTRMAFSRGVELTEHDTRRGLVAVLLNPPAMSGGNRSRNAVARAASALGYDQAVIVNLCAVPTPTVAEVNYLDVDAWNLAQADLVKALSDSSAVLAGWGIAGLTGAARHFMNAQVRLVIERALECGISAFWMVGGEPRHPSRWHQYVSDKYERTSGGSFEERIAQVLVQVPTDPRI